jgi:hypothetical protein
MYNILKFLCMVFLLIISILSSYADDKISISSQSFYLKGCRIPVTVNFTAENDKSLYLHDITTLPRSILEEVTDVDNKIIEYDNKKILKTFIGMPPVMNHKKLCNVKKGETLQFIVDLNEKYSLNEGEYKYRLILDIDLVYEVKIKIVNVIQQSIWDDTKMYTLSVVKTDDEKINKWYLKYEYKINNDYNIQYYDIPENSKIVDVKYDFKLSKWLVLENNKKYELLLCKDKIPKFFVLLPWDEKEISLKTTEYPFEYLPFVVAGRKGEIQFTTTYVVNFNDGYFQ